MLASYHDATECIKSWPTVICMQAVHSGADLESAISNCMGYRSEVISVTSWSFSSHLIVFVSI